MWWSSINAFTGNPGVFNGDTSKNIGGYTGVGLKIEMPYSILCNRIDLYPRNPYGYPQYTQNPRAFKFIASKDNEFWDLLHEETNFVDRGGTAHPFHINTTQYYKYFAIVVTGVGNSTLVSIVDLQYFGTREQGQSVLHDGQLTLTKSLTVPRIGPALDADDTPRRDRLVVEYNTSTNPTFEGVVRDTSGRGNDGVFLAGASYDATEKAFKFDGLYDYIETFNIGNPAGESLFSGSFWYNPIGPGSDSFVWIGGQEAVGKAFLVKYNNPNFEFSFFGNDAIFNYTLQNGTWYHIAFAYSGGTASSGRRIWVNGVEVAYTSGASSTALNLDANTELRIGGRIANNNQDLHGSLSNFKLYNTALTASEVKTLYDMGRCDEGHHVVNFSKTRVGIGLGGGEAPTYTLDVRGQIRSQGSLVTSFTGQHICSADEPMEKGLIVSAKKNRFVKLNGFATGREAITVDESLPIVSLSNVAQDKACFGVVSSIEKPSPKRKQEIGGVISESVKIAGDNRAIVNSVGEGAIWVVNTGGSLESGDYITTSNVAGYGQKQDGAGLMNYTVAKITMDCDFTASNVAVQTIKREETGTRTITEDTWNQLVDYDRSSNTETQYSNTLVSSAYTDQPGYTPREVTTIMDYTDGSNLISTAEWSNLESNIQNTYQSNTFTEIVDYTKFVNLSEWSNLTAETQATYSEAEITTYYQIQRGENVLDENGQLQWEDKTGATEAPYEKRFLAADGTQTDEANTVHIAAFVGCTYHCG